ncbi:hypothetical protein HYV71_02875 [Candidatus Uhrbacteria bacterium]|nr:hypothetical protein [Candidatus Uhrbacteria bacterium]
MRRSTNVHSLPITKARVNLGGIVAQAYHKKSSFLLEKGGIPVAGILGIDDFEDWLEVSDPTVKQAIEKGYTEYKKGKTKKFETLLTELH